MKLLELVIIVIAFGMQSTISSLPSSELPSDTKRAFDFLDKLLQPAGGCNGTRYSVAYIGFGGGFASQFQMAASNWIRAAAAFDYTIPVVVRGTIHGYTTTEECTHVKHSYSCVLLPMSSCEDEILAGGVFVESDPVRFNAEFNVSLVPQEFASLGLNWWWGIVQSRMFRVQPSVEKHIQQKIEYLKEIDGYGFQFNLPTAGLHVRHGDKSSDGFRDHTLSSEIMTIYKSPECIDKVTCLGKMNHHNSSATTNTSDRIGTVTMNRTSGHLAVYVASDDRKVLSVSKKLGFLCFSEGVSQNSSSKGMATDLTNTENRAIAYNATLEIMTDLYFLSHCSTLVGIAASQVFRVAASISRASGRLKTAVAMDFDQIQRIQYLSRKYDVPFPDVDSFIDAKLLPKIEV